MKHLQDGFTAFGTANPQPFLASATRQAAAAPRSAKMAMHLPPAASAALEAGLVEVNGGLVASLVG